MVTTAHTAPRVASLSSANMRILPSTIPSALPQSYPTPLCGYSPPRPLRKGASFRKDIEKNSLCNALFPEDDITILHPPLGDPESCPEELWLLNKTLYSLRRLPQHWYNLITNILKGMGLTSSKNNLCLFSWIIDNSTPPKTPRHPIHTSLYVDYFFPSRSRTHMSLASRNS